MSKKYYWKMNGHFYEVSKEEYKTFKKEYDRHKKLKKAENDAVVLSLDALREQSDYTDVFLTDENIDLEEQVVHKIMLEKLGIT